MQFRTPRALPPAPLIVVAGGTIVARLAPRVVVRQPRPGLARRGGLPQVSVKGCTIMASIFLKDGVFVARFRHQGREYKRSLKTGDRRDAEHALAEIVRAVHRLRVGLMAVPAGVTVPEFVLSGGTLAAPAPPAEPVAVAPTLAEAADRYVGNLAHLAESAGRPPAGPPGGRRKAVSRRPQGVRALPRSQVPRQPIGRYSRLQNGQPGVAKDAALAALVSALRGGLRRRRPIAARRAGGPRRC